MIEVTFYLKTGLLVRIVCEKIKISSNGLGAVTGYESEGGLPTVENLVYIDPDRVDAITKREYTP